jgi:hypothetical protein
MYYYFFQSNIGKGQIIRDVKSDRNPVRILIRVSSGTVRRQGGEYATGGSQDDSLGLQLKRRIAECGYPWEDTTTSQMVTFANETGTQ